MGANTPAMQGVGRSKDDGGRNIEMGQMSALIAPRVQ